MRRGAGVTGSAYALLNSRPTSVFGTPHERIATIFEVVRGHGGVLAEFRRRPGRWLLWISLDDVRCPDCADNGGRYLQFVFMEDGRSVIGECSANEFLPDELQLTEDQAEAMRALGWKDPVPEYTPNWHIEATSADEVRALGQASVHTIIDVFGLHPRDRAVIQFQRRIPLSGSA